MLRGKDVEISASLQSSRDSFLVKTEYNGDRNFMIEAAVTQTRQHKSTVIDIKLPRESTFNETFRLSVEVELEKGNTVRIGISV